MPSYYGTTSDDAGGVRTIREALHVRRRDVARAAAFAPPGSEPQPVPPQTPLQLVVEQQTVALQFVGGGGLPDVLSCFTQSISRAYSLYPPAMFAPLSA